MNLDSEMLHINSDIATRKEMELKKIFRKQSNSMKKHQKQGTQVQNRDSRNSVIKENKLLHNNYILNLFYIYIYIYL